MKFNLFSTHKYSPVVLLAFVAVAISFLTRIALLVFFRHDFNMNFSLVAGSFLIGMLYDLVVSFFIIILFVLQITFTNNFIYVKKGRIAVTLLFAVIMVILLFTRIIPKDFSVPLYNGLIAYIILRYIIFLFLSTRKAAFREKWRSAVLQIFFFIALFLLLFNAVSEWFFWDEFSSRYNFIAVDYLVYTNEVIGNIKESYPLFSIITSVTLVTGLVFLVLKRYISKSVSTPMRFIKRAIIAFLLLLVPFLTVLLVKPEWKNFSKNNYANELAGNGMYEFAIAFQNNQLDFYKYYKTIPDKKAFEIIRDQLASPNSRFITDDIFNIEREINYPGEETKRNVVLISVESLSGSFMKAFGSTKNITPQLDSLANEGLFFANLYASGTRTVRGLEALSLSIPPTPGQSIVKRPGNENLFSLGHVFKQKGYITQYLYGGYGYFDNMNYFFSNNDYDVIDRTALEPESVHYSNIWGVADEDLFTLALRTMDSNHAKGKPFFSQVMTVSNHRPYTYPDGRIDIPSSSQSRDGAVKYTDFAIGDFIKRASHKPWFSNTIFVIVADHCASSAGSEALPVTGYHIPLIIYSPHNIQPRKIDVLTAQIDIVPTILGLLNFDYTSKFFGQDVLNMPAENERAFISTYQGLGYIKNGELVIQSPLKKIKSYKPDFVTGKAADIPGTDSIQQQAIAYYQVAAWVIKNDKYSNGVSVLKK